MLRVSAILLLTLLAVVVTSIAKVDSLAADSNAAVIRADQLARVRAALGEALQKLERSARQYQILHDQRMHENYLTARNGFLAVTAQLEPALTVGLEELLAQERSVHERIEQGAFSGDEELATAFASWLEQRGKWGFQGEPLEFAKHKRTTTVAPSSAPPPRKPPDAGRRAATRRSAR